MSFVLPTITYTPGTLTKVEVSGDDDDEPVTMLVEGGDEVEAPAAVIFVLIW